MDGETQNAQDARVEQLWRTLDTRKEGHLDLNGLKKGLRKMDHREIYGLPQCAQSDLS
jgi:solute carrier family 25 phosphate transporter 23/24/25/41